MKESLLHRCGPLCLYSNVCKAIFICTHLYSRHLQVSFPGTMNSRVAWQFGMAIPFSYVWWGWYLVRDVLAKQAEVSTWGQQDWTEWASYGLLENPEGTQVKMVGIESAQSRDKGKTMLATVLFLKNQYLNYKHDYHSWFEWILSTPPQPPQSSYIGTVIPLCGCVNRGVQWEVFRSLIGQSPPGWNNQGSQILCYGHCEWVLRKVEHP